MGHYDSCRDQDTIETLRSKVSELEGRLRAQTSATVSAAQIAERALAQLVEMQPVVDEAVLVIDRMAFPPPRLVEVVRRYQGRRV